MRLIDLSQNIFPGQPVYPGHQPTSFVPSIEKNKCTLEDENVTALLVTEHGGSHTDSFIHTTPESAHAFSIEQLPAKKFMGPAVCLDVSHVPDSEFITIKDLKMALEHVKGNIEFHGLTVLLHTGIYNKYFPTKNYLLKNPGLNRESTEWLAERGVINVGIDTISIDVTPNKGYEWKPAHNVCTTRWMLNTENLGDMTQVLNQQFYYIGLPLKIRNGTAGLIRAVAVVSNKL